MSRSTVGTTRYAIPGKIDNEPIDAERRLIYITDLDCWSILALVKTAPESLASLLGDFLQKHICARASVSVSFASIGPPIFALNFHMPFRVWRTSNELLRDKRIKKSNGKPLRTSHDVSFLMSSLATSESSEVHGIYAGHVACMVSGRDKWRWTAHLAIDTWFDMDEDIPGKVMRYHYDLEESGIELDPLSCGNDDAKLPILDPRTYFLRIVGIRFSHIKGESDLLFQNCNEGVTNLFQGQKQLFSKLRPFSSGSDFEKHEGEFETLEKSLEELKEVLNESLDDLHETLKTVESFLSSEVYFFSNHNGQPGDASEFYPFLSNIRGDFNELARLFGFFNSLKDKCDDMMENCKIMI
ncbi:uncharacterized protein CTRU02_210647 [Colletotrichum truncatum]|uniref:Uncharacterized protein n=1 Tax=Colletotrichum truncatum TaxID=5467 RepID=A0ACC3YPK6_COLTU